MKFIFLSIFLLFCTSALFAREQPLEVFNQANALYEKGNYPKAIELYESLAAQNQVNAALFYNLGNAYYRDQRPGKAILNYERALRLAPGDADIRFNLQFLKDTVKEPPLPFLSGMLSALTSAIRLNVLVMLCSVLFIMLAAGGIWYLFTRKRTLLLVNGGVALLLIISAGWLYLKVSTELSTHRGVVITGPTDVRNGPESTSSVGFTLPEGRSVIILGEKDEWAAIGMPVEGLRGWIEKKYIEAI